MKDTQNTPPPSHIVQSQSSSRVFAACPLKTIANSDVSADATVKEGASVTVTCSTDYAIDPPDKDENPATTKALTCSSGALSATVTCAKSRHTCERAPFRSLLRVEPHGMSTRGTHMICTAPSSETKSSLRPWPSHSSLARRISDFGEKLGSLSPPK